MYKTTIRTKWADSGIRVSFPFEKESFDLVFMRSVFTQMPAPDLERYVKEISRVLAPDGRFLGTFSF
jgi:ubiquinone/menaquinone biosynthesis C-methylase UbiE